MVEHNGCRCACQGGEEFELPPDDSGESSGTGCCNAQVFTSVLLGILSCVLMTGGVFLAFHRWDPMWLLVSGIGVLLIFIGTILHCCNNSGSTAAGSRRHNSKVCCGRPIPPDNPHSHMVTHSGSLTEQLLPLSNARSVSQLSLNMLPGYFPPVVTAYGIEQHSAVVQNINRLVQQQQQSSQNSGSTSPGGATKSFILLSLPGDNPPANLQNLVATVYQLDGNVASETTTPDANSTPDPAVGSQPKPSLVLKSVEVQTCQAWPNVSVPNISDPSSVPSTSRAGNSSEPERVSTTMASGTTQTDEHTNSEIVINLMDCSTDVSTNCDNLPTPCEMQGNFASIPLSSSVTLVDVSEPSTSSVSQEPPSTVFVNIPETNSNSTADALEVNLVSVEDTSFVSTDVPEILSDVLVDISENTRNCNHSNFASEQFSNHDEVTQSSNGLLLEENNNTHIPSGSSRDNELDFVPPLGEIQPPETTPHSMAINSLESSTSSNLSAIDADIDDGEFLDRSSPPPSYDDVTHEGESSVGAFGLAYGTI